MNNLICLVTEYISRATAEKLAGKKSFNDYFLNTVKKKEHVYIPE